MHSFTHTLANIHTHTHTLILIPPAKFSYEHVPMNETTTATTTTTPCPNVLFPRTRRCRRSSLAQQQKVKCPHRRTSQKNDGNDDDDDAIDWISCVLRSCLLAFDRNACAQLFRIRRSTIRVLVWRLISGEGAGIFFTGSILAHNRRTNKLSRAKMKTGLLAKFRTECPADDGHCLRNVLTPQKVPLNANNRHNPSALGPAFALCKQHFQQKKPQHDNTDTGQ